MVARLKKTPNDDAVSVLYVRGVEAERLMAAEMAVEMAVWFDMSVGKAAPDAGPVDLDKCQVGQQTFIAARASDHVGVYIRDRLDIWNDPVEIICEGKPADNVAYSDRDAVTDLIAEHNRNRPVLIGHSHCDRFALAGRAVPEDEPHFNVGNNPPGDV